MLCVSECYTEIEVSTCGCVTATQSFFPNDTLECGTLTMTMCPLNQEELLGGQYYLDDHIVVVCVCAIIMNVMETKMGIKLPFITIF